MQAWMKESTNSKIQEKVDIHMYISTVCIRIHIYIYVYTLSCTFQPSPTCLSQFIVCFPKDLASKEYKEWAQVSRNICTSFIHKLGVPLSKVWYFFFSQKCRKEGGVFQDALEMMMFFFFFSEGGGGWGWPLTLDLTISSQFVGGSWEFGASDLGCGLSQKLGAGDTLLPCSPGVEGKWTGWFYMGWDGWNISMGWLNGLVELRSFFGWFWAVW